jgi:prolyl-tRNA editing enzyme YbaK/EbsC (Cys-tRNA(Pro) deacylase)
VRRLLCFALQYTTKLDLTALEKEVRVCAEPNLSKRAVNLQVADETECAAVTGFVRNAVTPFGMQCTLPVRLCLWSLRDSTLICVSFLLHH